MQMKATYASAHEKFYAIIAIQVATILLLFF